MLTIHYFEELPSTNEYLRANYENYQDFSVIIADNQTNGKGRLDHTWESGKKDLTFSILFKDTRAHHMIAPLAILFVLKKYHLHASIKWPNDIYLNEKKLAGILIQKVIIDTEEKGVIVGIGINFSKKKLEASYIKKIDKKSFLDQLLFFYNQLLFYSDHQLYHLYKNNQLLIGRKINYDNEIFTIFDVTIEGRLVIKKENVIMYLDNLDVHIKEMLV